MYAAAAGGREARAAGAMSTQPAVREGLSAERS